MKNIIDIIQLKTMHHAQCFVDETSNTLQSLEKILATLVREKQCAMYRFPLDILDIKQAHEIRSLVTTKSALELPLVLFITFHQATVEAQNAFLKAIEEPAENISIICVIPRLSILIPTLASRFMIHTHESTTSRHAERIPIQKFIEESVEQRLHMIEKIMKDKKNPFTRIDVIQFLDTLEYTVVEHQTKLYINNIQDIYTLKTYAQLSGCSPKMILEYTALTLPMLKK